MTEGYTKNTGEQPVPTGTLVDVIYADGERSYDQPAGLKGKSCDSWAEDWTLTGDSGDIIEWKLSETE